MVSKTNNKLVTSFIELNDLLFFYNIELYIFIMFIMLQILGSNQVLVLF